MKIARFDEVNVFKTKSREGADNYYCGIIANVSGQPTRRAYMTVFLSGALKDHFEYPEERSNLRIQIMEAWLTVDAQSKPALYIKSGAVVD